MAECGQGTGGAVEVLGLNDEHLSFSTTPSRTHPLTSTAVFAVGFCACNQPLPSGPSLDHKGSPAQPSERQVMFETARSLGASCSVQPVREDSLRQIRVGLGLLPAPEALRDAFVRVCT